jgi:CubicO group peptidase (beta-lactamase class C family)
MYKPSTTRRFLPLPVVNIESVAVRKCTRISRPAAAVLIVAMLIAPGAFANSSESVSKSAVSNYWRGPADSDLDNEDGFWRVQDPKLTPLSSEILIAYKDLCEDTKADAYLILYDGAIVAEGYSSRYSEPMPTMSSAKSITALLVGMLIDDGKISSVSEPVCKFIPEWSDENRRTVTIRNLLTMTSGLKRMIGQSKPNLSVGFVADKNSYVISLQLDNKPGEHCRLW